MCHTHRSFLRRNVSDHRRPWLSRDPCAHHPAKLGALRAACACLHRSVSKPVGVRVRRPLRLRICWRCVASTAISAPDTHGGARPTDQSARLASCECCLVLFSDRSHLCGCARSAEHHAYPRPEPQGLRLLWPYGELIAQRGVRLSRVCRPQHRCAALHLAAGQDCGPRSMPRSKVRGRHV